MDLKCIISDPFKREHKRQYVQCRHPRTTTTPLQAPTYSTHRSSPRRLSELEQETYELRRRLQTQAQWNGHNVATPAVSIASSLSGMTPGLKHNGSPPQNPAAAIVSPPSDDLVDDQLPVMPQPTVPQTLEGVTVSAAVIDELFQMYVPP